MQLFRVSSSLIDSIKAYSNPFRTKLTPSFPAPPPHYVHNTFYCTCLFTSMLTLCRFLPTSPWLCRHTRTALIQLENSLTLLEIMWKYKRHHFQNRNSGHFLKTVPWILINFIYKFYLSLSPRSFNSRAAVALGTHLDGWNIHVSVKVPGIWVDKVPINSDGFYISATSDDNGKFIS